MSLSTLTKAVLATAIVAAPFAASAQNPAPQPYNPQDPQNYSAPAQQTYQQAYPQQQQAYPQQQQPYPQQQQPYPQQQGYPQQVYPQQQQQQQPYPQQQQDPNAYGQQPVMNNPDQDQANYEAGQEAIAQAPPALPQYDQPEPPGPGYMWTPGYWAWGPTGYYWVPGAWVEPPYQGALWTPGYWGDGDDGFYFWNAGYWGPTVGFYGGINYGFGYFGSGFYGGYWNGGVFFYNSAYWHIGRWGRYHYTQRVAGVGFYHPGGASFVTARAAIGMRGGAAFGSHATVGAYRAGFGGNLAANRGGAQGFAGARGGYSNMRPAVGSNFGGYRTGPAPNGSRPGAPAPQGHAPAPAPHASAPAPHAASAPHSSGGGGSHGGGGGHK